MEKAMRDGVGGAIFDAYVKGDLINKDVNATTETMTANPYIHHVPTLVVRADRRGELLQRDFIGRTPADMRVEVSRAVGEDQVVDELMLYFTYDSASISFFRESRRREKRWRRQISC